MVCSAERFSSSNFRARDVEGAGTCETLPGVAVGPDDTEGFRVATTALREALRSDCRARSYSLHKRIALPGGRKGQASEPLSVIRERLPFSAVPVRERELVSRARALHEAREHEVARPSSLFWAVRSGGNPRIAKADGDAPVQAYIAAMPGWKRDNGKRLDALIVRNVPNVRKAVKWNSPMYGIEGQGLFLGFHTFTHYVKVTFFRGTSLRPVPPGGTGKDARWIDIHEDDLDEAQMATWVKQAAALPGWVPGRPS